MFAVINGCNGMVEAEGGIEMRNATEEKPPADVQPSGTVTFVVVAGARADVVDVHLERALTEFGGSLSAAVDTSDVTVLAFSRPSAAVAAAVSLWDALGGREGQSKVGVHIGEAVPEADGRYQGATVTACLDLAARAEPGRVVVSAAVAAVVGRLPANVVVDPSSFARNTREGLPLALTALFGRKTAVDELRCRLDHDRLITLTGSGGVGKTRLAIEIGSSVADGMPAGVWFVDLAAITGAGGCGRALLKAIGAAEVRGVPAPVLVASELTGRGRALIVLDNCEHVLDEAAELVIGVLQSCPTVSVLVTSREPLDVHGEVVWRVPSLACPPPDDLDAAVDTSRYDAVALSIDRARRARPSFEVSLGDEAIIGRVCSRLDGIPLAIELAAARCRHLDDTAIAAGLDHRFSLLVGTSRESVPRQRTLRASVAWSYDITDHEEQVVLRRLGVFAGAFSLDAAEAVVASIGDVAMTGVFQLLSRLVDKNLVTIDDTRRWSTRSRRVSLHISQASCLAPRSGIASTTSWCATRCIKISDEKTVVACTSRSRSHSRAAPPDHLSST